MYCGSMFCIDMCIHILRQEKGLNSFGKMTLKEEAKWIRRGPQTFQLDYHKPWQSAALWTGRPVAKDYGDGKRTGFPPLSLFYNANDIDSFICMGSVVGRSIHQSREQSIRDFLLCTRRLLK